jgi:hypothetical protein
VGSTIKAVSVKYAFMFDKSEEEKKNLEAANGDA